VNVMRQGHPAGRARHDEPMSRHTSWRVGGPADLYFEPGSVEELCEFLSGLDPSTAVTWIGLGSNVLVREGGIRGAVIGTHGGALDGLDRSDELEIVAQAGVPCARIARQCARWGIGPAEFFAGIPGTLGGALTMNAGAFGGETWRHVLEVQVVNRRGELIWRKASQYQVGYRSVVGPEKDEWFVAARLRFEPHPEASPEKIRDMLARRKQTQPIGQPSCGSVFRNPPGDHAARLIEAAGLKGLRMGGAQVSEKHANFIINTGSATPAEIEALILHVRDRVMEKFGIQLQPEVRILGESA